MKPRTAAATYILSLLDGEGGSDLHFHAEDYKKKDRPLTLKQQARVDSFFDQYVGAIRNLLGTMSVEGDVAEVDGVTAPDTSTGGTTAADNSNAADTGADEPKADFDFAIPPPPAGFIGYPPVVIHIEKLIVNA